MQYLVISIFLFYLTGCTLNLQIENEVAGQCGSGVISETSAATEETIPTTDITTEIEGVPL